MFFTSLWYAAASTIAFFVLLALPDDMGYIASLMGLVPSLLAIATFLVADAMHKREQNETAPFM